MLKRTMTILLVILMVVASVVACGNNENNNNNAGNNDPVNNVNDSNDSNDSGDDAEDTKIGEGVKVGMVTDSGTITDKSFNQGTWEGILMAKEAFGIAERYLQPGGETTDDYLNEIGNLVDADHELIVTPGFKFEEAIFIAQDLYPDTKFVLIDGEPNNANWDDFVAKLVQTQYQFSLLNKKLDF